MFLPYPRAASVGSFKRPVAAAPAALVNELNVKTIQSGGTFGNANPPAYKAFSVKTSTGYAKVEWWDSTTGTGGNGSAFNDISFSKSIVSPYNNSSEKSLKVYSVNSSGTKSGQITSVIIDNGITPDISYVDFQGCTGAEGTIYILNTKITSLNLPNVNPGYATSWFAVIGNNSLTSLDLSKIPNSIWYRVYSNTSLTSITTTGIGAYIGSYGKNYTFLQNTLDLKGNSLGASALNTVYSGLATAGTHSYYPAYILVGGNPGTASDDPTIATAKNWTVYGT